MRILIGEHDPALGMFVERSLEKEGHTVTVAADGAVAATAIASADYDLFLLDLDLPGGLGMRVLEVARQLGNGMRILVLTAQAANLEIRIACLEAGADDCVMKPFAMRELKVRCRALLRRQDGGAVLRCGDLQLNRLQQSLECGEESIALSRREFGLLEYLMMNRGHCVSRATLLERVWSTTEAGNSNVVDVYINYLRRKLGPSASLIETVRGQGYRIAGLDRSRPVDTVPRLPSMPPVPVFQQPAAY
ncbi:MAG: winged helix-turn-helix domain-containing protein [Acidobacteriaceae bacterium]